VTLSPSLVEILWNLSMRRQSGLTLLQPSQELREAATRLGFTPMLEARGHDGLEVRV